MNPRWMILQSYFQRSWLGVIYMFAMYVVAFWFSLHYDRIEPALLIVYGLSTMFSSRLNATQTYSLSFNAPGYFDHHLFVAASALLVIGWLPAIMVSIWLDKLLPALGFLYVVTGFVMLGERCAPRLYTWAAGIIFAFVLLLFLFKIDVVWDPGTIGSVTLLLVGAGLLTAYFRTTQAVEYNPEGTASLLHGSQWVKDSVAVDPGNQVFIEKLGGPFFFGGFFSGDGHSPHGSQSGSPSFSALIKLADRGAGDWIHWQTVWLMIVLFSSLVTAAILIGGTEKAILALPKVLTCIIFMLYTSVAISSVVSIPWHMDALWVRAPVRNKTELLNLFILGKAKNIVKHFVLACLAVLGVNLVGGEFLFGIQMMLLASAVTSGGIATALVVNHFDLPMPVASLIGFAIVIGWALGVGWMNHPLPDNEVSFVFSMLGSGVVALVLAGTWWYRGFYEHRHNVLGAV